MPVGTFNKVQTLLCIHHIIDVKIEGRYLDISTQYSQCTISNIHARFSR